MNCDNLLIAGISFCKSTGKHSSENEEAVVSHGKIISDESYQLKKMDCKEKVDTEGNILRFYPVKQSLARR